jgi:hypothetical protein
MKVQVKVPDGVTTIPGFELDVPDPAPAMPKAEGESRVSQFNGDIYAAALDAQNGGKLVIDRSVKLDTGRPLVLRNVLAEGKGCGDKAPSIAGPVQINGDWGYLRDVTILNALVGLQVTGYNVGADHVRIMNCGQSMMVTDHCFYARFAFISAVIGNLKGLSLSTPAGSSDDNGQLQFDACKFGGEFYAIKRDPALAATMHRILLNQTQLVGGSSGDYIVDLLGLHGITLNTCDIETSGVGPAVAMVRLGGIGQTLRDCPFAFPSSPRTKKGIVADASFGLNALIDHCGFDYAPPSSTMITTATGLVCKHNFLAQSPASSALLYDGAKRGWVEGEDTGLWIKGIKRF